MKKAFLLTIIIPSLVIGHLTFVICGIAEADKLTGSGYDLYLNPAANGGGTLQGSGYTLQDAKGEAVGGSSSGGGFTLQSGTFGQMAGGTLSGIVKDSHGNLVANKEITVWIDGVAYTTTTDANGRFTLGNIPAGPHLVIIGYGGETKSQFVNVIGGGTTDMGTITLVPGGTVSGQLLGADGKPLASKDNITVTVNGQTFTGVSTNSQGWFAVDGVNGGTGKTVTVTTADGLTGSITNVGVTAGSATNLGQIKLNYTGTVPLTISRAANGRDILVTWDNTSFPDPQIFVLTGDGTGCYQNAYSADKWLKIASGSAYGGTTITTGAGTLTHVGQVGGGVNEAYYKGLMAGYTDYAAYIPSAPAVGKVNVTFAKAGGIKLMGVPVYDGKASAVLQSQLKSGQSLQLMPQAGSGLNIGTVTSAVFNTKDFDVNPTIGFWLQNQTPDQDVTITFVGAVIAGYYQRDIYLPDLTSNPIAVSIPTSANIGSDGDQVLPQAGSTSGLNVFNKVGGSWPSGFSTLNLNQGFWLYPKNAERWNVDGAKNTAKIESK